MKLIVLCGGKGTRLGGLTKDIPKALVTIGNKRIIDIALEPHNFEYIFSAGYHGLEMTNFVCTHYPGSECFVESEPLGTGGAIKAIADFDMFTVLNGDTLLDVDLEKLNMAMAYEFPDKDAGVVLGINAVTGEEEYAGAFIFRKSFLKFIEGSHLEDAIQECLKMDKAVFLRTYQKFYDLGTPEGIEVYKNDCKS